MGPNIFVRCGEGGTKLTNSTDTRKRLIINACLVIVLFIAAILVVDGFFNGMMVDWLEKNYSTHESYTNASGILVEIHRPDWVKVKKLVFVLFAAMVALIVLCTVIATKLAATKMTDARLKAISTMIHDYIFSDKDACDVFPEAYGAIAIQMSEIKDKIKAHEMALSQESERKNALITYLAHDLKTPLTSVIGYLSLLQEAPDMPLNLRIKYTNTAFKKARRLEGLINEFFDITRFSLQQVHIDTEPFDLSYLLMQLSEEFFPQATKRGNWITLDKPDELPMTGDAEKLARMLSNLLKNALSYSDPDTEIAIKAQRYPDCVKLSMSNHGPTIPEKECSRLFDKFYRIDAARSSETGGAGLGLSIAKEIVTLHHGTITVTSTNRLTCFTVTLPLRQPSMSLEEPIAER